MKIKTSLITLTCLSTIALVGVVLATELANIKLIKLEKTLIQVKSLEVSLLELNRIELEFLLDHTPSLSREFQKESEHFHAIFYEFEHQLSQQNLMIKNLDKLKSEVTKYENDFQIMVKEIDTNKDHIKEIKAEMKMLYKNISSLFLRIEETLENNIHEAQSDITTLIVASLTTVTLIMVFFLSVIGHSIQRKVKSLSHTMTMISEKRDFSIDADDTSSDEISDIAKAFNHVLEDVRGIIGTVQGSVYELSGTTGQLLKDGSNIESALHKQQAETDSVAAAATEMGESIQSVAAITELASSSAQTSLNLASDGLNEVEFTRKTIGNLSEDLLSASEEVHRLSELSLKITSVLDVIKEIAEQTNLLALNAAIEAARAGEQGRGFAVVADEVRTLAGRTQLSTEEITSIILAVQEQTQAVVKTIESCCERGTASVQSSEKAHNKIMSVIQDMQSILDNSVEVAAALEEQSAVSSDIARNINMIRDLTLVNVEGASKNAQSSSSVAQQNEKLSSAVSQFRI